MDTARDLFRKIAEPDRYPQSTSKPNHNPFIPGARKIGMDGRIARISVIK
ncbi:hypothetical protein HTIA_1022 [Halorhabdus tiamatea SARL4B]|uniref:Uncharacterized protein n=1 Tax=Halorhabdus tiamatea SARL4B TaxID=1033806 RepID=S6D2E2_9EURY|nr:hypothetical protein HTIA_1022 [Halorhabdus tiamatea SARL4B]